MVPASATRKLSSGAPPTAAHGAVGRARLAHRQPAPRERVRPPAAQRLGADPPARHRQRPGAQVEQQPLAHGEQREDHCLGDREGEPCVPRHVDQPGQQRDEEGQPEHQPGQQRGAQAAPPQRHGQQRRTGRGERPDPDRREGGRQGQPAGQRDGQRPGQRAGWRPRPGPPAQVPGPRRGAGGADSGWPGPRPGFGVAGAAGPDPGLARSPARAQAGRGSRAGAPGRGARRWRPHRPRHRSPSPLLPPVRRPCRGHIPLLVRVTGLSPPASTLARNSRRRLTESPAAGMPRGGRWLTLGRPGPSVAPWCPSLVP